MLKGSLFLGPFTTFYVIQLSYVVDLSILSYF